MSFIIPSFNEFRKLSGFFDIKLIHYLFQMEIDFNKYKQLRINQSFSGADIKTVDRREQYYKRYNDYHGI